MLRRGWCSMSLHYVFHRCEDCGELTSNKRYCAYCRTERAVHARTNLRLGIVLVESLRREAALAHISDVKLATELLEAALGERVRRREQKERWAQACKVCGKLTDLRRDHPEAEHAPSAVPDSSQSSSDSCPAEPAQDGLGAAGMSAPPVTDGQSAPSEGQHESP